jgi:hypothetical protein
VGKEIRIIVIAARKKPMNYTQQVRDQINIVEKLSQRSHPRMLLSGSSPSRPGFPIEAFGGDRL